MSGGRTVRRRNPLRRRSDRIQAWSAFLTIMTLLLVSPWVARYVARETYRDEVQASAWERQHRFQVPAVLLEDPSQLAGDTTDEGPPPPPPVSALASWVGPDGVARTGNVSAEPDRRAGSTQLIWVDDRGAVASTPLRRSPVFDAFAIAVMAVCGLVGGLAGVHRIIVWRLDRRRLRDWQAEWLMIEPLWRRR